MANNSLKFVVEVAADRANDTLNAITAAVNQAGVKMRTTMLGVGDASKVAGREVETLGDRMRQYAREQRQEGASARFFVNEIAGIVPVTGQARVALDGLANILAGGLGFGAVIAGVTAFVSWMRLAAEEEKKAREEAERHARALTDLSAAAALWRMREAYVASGGDPARIDRASARLERESAIQDQINFQLERQAGARREIARWTAELAALAEKKDIGMFDPTDAAHQVRAEEKIAEARRLDADATRQLQEAERALKDARAAGALQSQNAEKKAIEQKAEVQEKASAKASKQAEKDAKEAERARREEFERLKRQQEQQAALEVSYIDMVEDARDEAEERDRRAREAKVEAYQSMGERIGDALGRAIASGMSPLKSLGAMLKQVLIEVLNIARKRIIASALETGGEMAKSQAGIPVVGPMLAAGALAAGVAMVMGLLGSLPSAAGGMKVPQDTLALIHKDEHVIPKRIAEQYERGIAGGGGVTNNFYGTVIDERSTRRFVTSEEFQRASRRATRRRG